jgi:ribosomal-protein-alanine N-acetyltransferase
MIDVVIRDMIESDISTVTKYDAVMIGETFGASSSNEYRNNNTLMKYLVMETKDTKEFVGQMTLWIDDFKAQINNFYIIHKYQKQKLGKLFLNYVIAYLKSMEIKEITLEVRKSNEAAIQLYKLFDFRQISIRKNYYKDGEDALFMYLRIGSD